MLLTDYNGGFVMNVKEHDNSVNIVINNGGEMAWFLLSFHWKGVCSLGEVLYGN